MTSTVWHPADPKITTVQVQSPYMRYIQVLFLTEDSSHSHRVVLFKGSSPLFFFYHVLQSERACAKAGGYSIDGMRKQRKASNGGGGPRLS